MFNDKEIKELKDRVFTLEEKVKICEQIKENVIKNNEARIQEWLLSIMDNAEYLSSLEWKMVDNPIGNKTFKTSYKACLNFTPINISLQREWTDKANKYYFLLEQNNIYITFLKLTAEQHEKIEKFITNSTKQKATEFILSYLEKNNV